MKISSPILPASASATPTTRGLASGVTAVDLRSRRRWPRSMCAAAVPAPARARCSISPTPSERIDAIALVGGSAFGLEAGGGVQAWLAEQGRGFAVRGAVIPIVPGAICFDLLNGGDKNWGRFRALPRSRLRRGGGRRNRFRARQRRRRTWRHHREFQGRARLGLGGDARWRHGRCDRGGQCGRQRDRRRRAVVLGRAVRNRRRISADAGCRRRSRRTC